jgi:hypothetical protein
MCRNLRSPLLNRTSEPHISPCRRYVPDWLADRSRTLAHFVVALPSSCPHRSPHRRVPARSEPGHRLRRPARVLNWHGEEVEHRLSYLSVESRSREGDQHRPQSGCSAPMYGRPLGNPPSNWEVSDAHDFDAFIIGQRLPYRCFGNKRLTAHSAHRRQRELLRHLQHVHGVVTAAVSKIRCHGQRADENDSGEHRRNSRSGAWVRSDDTLAGEGRLPPFYLGFTGATSWIPKLYLRLHSRAVGCPPPREVP